MYIIVENIHRSCQEIIKYVFTYRCRKRLSQDTVCFLLQNLENQSIHHIILSSYTTHNFTKLFYRSFHYRKCNFFLRYDNRFLKHTVYCLQAQFSDELVFIIVHHNHKHFSCDAEVFQHVSFRYFHNNLHLTGKKNQHGAVRSDLEVYCVRTELCARSKTQVKIRNRTHELHFYILSAH